MSGERLPGCNDLCRACPGYFKGINGRGVEILATKTEMTERGLALKRNGELVGTIIGPKENRVFVQLCGILEGQVLYLLNLNGHNGVVSEQESG
jgi:hypothetical protein